MSTIKYLFYGVRFFCKLLFFTILEWIDGLKNLINPEYKKLDDDVVLITGAARGLGRSLCLEFSKYCSNIIAIDVNENGLSETVQQVKEAKPNCQIKTFVCDLKNKESISRTISQIKQEYTRVTVLVNNAGVVGLKSLLDMSRDNFEDCLSVNLLAHFELIRAFLPGMLMRKNSDTGKQQLPRGHIVSILSLAAVSPNIHFGDYGAAKSGVSQMIRTLELELACQGIIDEICNTRVYPCVLNTPMTLGCQSVNPLFFPIVDVFECARQIVDGVRLNRREIYVTDRYWWLALCEHLIPPRVMLLLRKSSPSYMIPGDPKIPEEKTKSS